MWEKSALMDSSTEWREGCVIASRPTLCRARHCHSSCQRWSLRPVIPIFLLSERLAGREMRLFLYAYDYNVFEFNGEPKQTGKLEIANLMRLMVSAGGAHSSG